jgi:hypothetical protein
MADYAYASELQLDDRLGFSRRLIWNPCDSILHRFTEAARRPKVCLGQLDSACSGSPARHHRAFSRWIFQKLTPMSFIKLNELT